MTEQALTVRDIIKLLADCNPDAYVFLDDDGIGQEFVKVSASNEGNPYYSQLADGTEVPAVYLLLKGQSEAAQAMLEAMTEQHQEELKKEELSIHPLAMPGNHSGAFDLNAGDRFVYDLDGRHGVADEFLHDGEAFVRFDDGTIGTIKWNDMSPEKKD